jgi:hypothetical protein
MQKGVDKRGVQGDTKSALSSDLPPTRIKEEHPKSHGGLRGGRWTPWLPAIAAGPGRFCFCWPLVNGALGEPTESAGGRDGRCHGQHPGVSLRAVSGRAAGRTSRSEPQRPIRVDAAGPLLRAAAPSPGHRPCAVHPQAPASHHALPPVRVRGSPRRPAPEAPGLSHLSNRLRDPQRESRAARAEWRTGCACPCFDMSGRVNHPGLRSSRHPKRERK